MNLLMTNDKPDFAGNWRVDLDSLCASSSGPKSRQI